MDIFDKLNKTINDQIVAIEKEKIKVIKDRLSELGITDTIEDDKERKFPKFLLEIHATTNPAEPIEKIFYDSDDGVLMIVEFRNKELKFSEDNKCSIAFDYKYGI